MTAPNREIWEIGKGLLIDLVLSPLDMVRTVYYIVTYDQIVCEP